MVLAEALPALYRLTLRSTHTLPACPQLYERFRPGQQPPKSLGPSRDYNVDMVPKFIMNSGELVRGPAPICHLR
jgi:hypothetical protein